MTNNRKTAYIGEECVACGRCVKECPLGAIAIHKGMYAKLDEKKCIGCGKCVKSCPASVIELMAREAETA